MLTKIANIHRITIRAASLHQMGLKVNTIPLKAIRHSTLDQAVQCNIVNISHISHSNNQISVAVPEEGSGVDLEAVVATFKICTGMPTNQEQVEARTLIPVM
jgi:hypothetical protein